jgi:hypothetical protein
VLHERDDVEPFLGWIELSISEGIAFAPSPSKDFASEAPACSLPCHLLSGRSTPMNQEDVEVFSKETFLTSVKRISESAAGNKNGQNAHAIAIDETPAYACASFASQLL